MKKLPLMILAILLIGCTLILTMIEKKDEHTPEPVDLPRGHAPVARQADTNDYDEERWRNIDTLVLVDGKALGGGWIAKGEYEKYGMRYDTTVVAYDPTLRQNLLTPTTFSIDIVGKNRRFDAKSTTCIADLKAFIGPINGYSRYQRDYYLTDFHQADSAMPEIRYIVVIDYPDSIDDQDEIMPWVASLVDRSPTMDEPPTSPVAGYRPEDRAKYAGKQLTGKILGDLAAKKFFSDSFGDAEDCPFGPLGYITNVDLRARVSNDRYVTYRSFVHSHEAVTHGMYAEYLHTLDRKNDREVDFDYLFRPGASETVHRLLYAAIGADTVFVKWHSLEPTADAVERWANSRSADPEANMIGLKQPLPKPALTEDGIVFSYQPYEIGCFAEGVYHFTIPYTKAMPYLTPQARAIIGI